MERRPQYQSRARQQRALDGLIQLAQQAKDDDPSVEGDHPNAADEADQNDGEDGDHPDAADEPKSRPMERQCVRLCIALLAHLVHSRHYQNGIVSALSVSGIDIEILTWLPAENYTPTLSAVAKLARMMVVLETYDSVQVPEQAAMVDLVSQKVERYIMVHQPAPMKWIFMTRTCGMKIRYHTTLICYTLPLPNLPNAVTCLHWSHV